MISLFTFRPSNFAKGPSMALPLPASSFIGLFARLVQAGLSLLIFSSGFVSARVVSIEVSPGSGSEVGVGTGRAGASATFAAAYPNDQGMLQHLPKCNHLPHLARATNLLPTHKRRNHFPPVPLLDDFFGIVEIMTVFHDDLDMREFFFYEREDQLIPLPRVGRRVLTKKTTDMTKLIRLSLYCLHSVASGLAYFFENEVRYAPLFKDKRNDLLGTTT
jgi:hypothetical protein